jgi:hypothetical protein
MDDDMKNLLAGVTAVVEANNFEKSMLWAENRRRATPRTWEDNLSGRGATVGHFGGEPVAISLFTANIDGEKVLFWHATSQTVNYPMVDEWLEQNLPRTAFRADDPDRLNRTDAQNFHSVFGRRRAEAA